MKKNIKQMYDPMFLKEHARLHIRIIQAYGKKYKCVLKTLQVIPLSARITLPLQQWS